MQEIVFCRLNKSLYGLHLFSSYHHHSCFIYVDWAGYPNTRHPTLEFGALCFQVTICCLGPQNGKLPYLVPMLMPKPNICGVANVVSESFWLHNLLLELYCSIPKATLVYYDNINDVYRFGNDVQHNERGTLKLLLISFVKKLLVFHQYIILHTFSPKALISFYYVSKILNSHNISEPPDSTITCIRILIIISQQYYFLAIL